MELHEKSSYLVLFSALLPLRSGNATLAKALRDAPLSGRARGLADQLSTDLPNYPEELPKTVPEKIQNLVNSATNDWRPCNPPESRVHPGLGSQHISQPGAIEEVQLTATPLRCPVCANERTVDLDLWQREHLRIRGHLEMHCGYCGTNSLWEPAEISRKEACELVI